MNIAEKLVKIAENEPKIYEVGKTEGYNNGYTEGYEIGKSEGGDTDAAYEQGKAEGIEQGYTEGKQAEYDAFWDAYQQEGKRTFYRYAFNFGGWTEQNFKPKYDIIPTGEITSIFANTTINADLVEICEKQGIVMDFSQITQFEYCFQNSDFTRVGVIDARKSDKFVSVFSGAKNLVTIDEIILSKKCTNYSNAFTNCSALKNVKFSGEIVNSLNIYYSHKLSRASIESLINCLSDTTSEKTLTLSRTAVDKAFEYYDSDGELQNGAASWEWYELTESKPNWTISLV